MKLSNIFILVAITFLVFTCKENEIPKEETTNSDNSHNVIVQEVIQATSYTYLKVKEGDKDYWIAATKMNAKEGDELYHDGGMEMKNFESRDLERTFESIYFVQEVSNKPLGSSASSSMGSNPHMQKPTVEKQAVNIEPVEGGITIAELFSNKESYSKRVVKIKGKVAKYNSGIMGRNWVHIQDGTNANGLYDLTVTTHDQVTLGNIVVFEGVIALNKDFGAGYSYDVIMEDSKLIK